MRRALVLVLAALGVLAAGLPALGAAPSPDEQAIVASGLLRRADFPAGWTATKKGSSPNFAKLGVACRPLVTALNGRVIRESSSGFILNNAERASNTVVLFGAPAGAVALFTALQNPVTTACYRRSATVSVAETAARSGVKLQVVSVAPLSVAPAGDQSLGYEAVVRASAPGQSQLIYEDAVFIRVGRAAVSFDFVNTNGSPNGAFAAQIQAVVGRVQAAE
jgi:hypothetical protein